MNNFQIAVSMMLDIINNPTSRNQQLDSLIQFTVHNLPSPTNYIDSNNQYRKFNNTLVAEDLIIDTTKILKRNLPIHNTKPQLLLFAIFFHLTINNQIKFQPTKYTTLIDELYRPLLHLSIQEIIDKA
jgi:hypothetical protein